MNNYIAGTIASGAKVSSQFAIPANSHIVGLFVDSSLTSTSLTFIADINNGTLNMASLISDGAGGSYTRTVRAGDYVPLDPNTFSGVNTLQVVGGSSEGALRNLVLVTKTDI